MADRPDAEPIFDPEGRLENAFIAEFLQRHGYDAERLKALPAEERERVLKEAARFAAGKLAEVNARAHFVEDMHHED